MQIKKYYKREATIISPPVAVEKFRTTTPAKEQKYFINYSRQVNWKRLDLIIEACLRAKQPLLLIGDGPEHKNLIKLAGNSDLI